MDIRAHRFTKPPVEFHWAGFGWPRFVAMLPRGAFAERIKRARNPVTGPYYHGPQPITGRGDMLAFFYLESDFMPGLRWQYADELARSIRHTGWHTDPGGIGETIRGVVFRLPKNRGLLTGWSMGEGMASVIDYGDIFDPDDETGAALSADSMAENAAARELEYLETLEDDDDDETAGEG